MNRTHRRRWPLTESLLVALALLAASASVVAGASLVVVSPGHLATQLATIRQFSGEEYLVDGIWTKWRHDAQQSGRAGDEFGNPLLGLAKAALLWTSNLGAPIFSSPTVAPGTDTDTPTLYVGTGTPGRLYALDSLSGAVRWVWPPLAQAGVGAIVSSPLVVDLDEQNPGTQRRIYFGDLSGRLHSLLEMRTTDATTGATVTTVTKVWTYPDLDEAPESSIAASPAFTPAGFVVCRSVDAIFALRDGDPPSGPNFADLVWRFRHEPFAFATGPARLLDSSPAVAELPNNQVVVIVGSQEGRVYGINEKPGAGALEPSNLRWVFPPLTDSAMGRMSASPAVGMLDGSFFGDTVARPVAIIGDNAGRIVILRADTGTLVGEIPTTIDPTPLAWPQTNSPALELGANGHIRRAFIAARSATQGVMLTFNLETLRAFTLDPFRATLLSAPTDSSAATAIDPRPGVAPADAHAVYVGTQLSVGGSGGFVEGLGRKTADPLSLENLDPTFPWNLDAATLTSNPFPISSSPSLARVPEGIFLRTIDPVQLPDLPAGAGPLDAAAGTTPDRTTIVDTSDSGAFVLHNSLLTGGYGEMNAAAFGIGVSTGFNTVAETADTVSTGTAPQYFRFRPTSTVTTPADTVLPTTLDQQRGWFGALPAGLAFGAVPWTLSARLTAVAPGGGLQDARLWYRVTRVARNPGNGALARVQQLYPATLGTWAQQAVHLSTPASAANAIAAANAARVIVSLDGVPAFTAGTDEGVFVEFAVEPLSAVSAGGSWRLGADSAFDFLQPPALLQWLPETTNATRVAALPAALTARGWVDLNDRAGTSLPGGEWLASLPVQFITDISQELPILKGQPHEVTVWYRLSKVNVTGSAIALVADLTGWKRAPATGGGATIDPGIRRLIQFRTATLPAVSFAVDEHLYLELFAQPRRPMGASSQLALEIDGPDSGLRIGGRTVLFVGAGDGNVVALSNTGTRLQGGFDQIFASLAQLQIVKTVDKTVASPPVGPVKDTLTYRITVTNLGPSFADSVTVSDVIPIGTTGTTATPLPDTGGAPPWPQGTLLTWEFGTLFPGEVREVELKVDVDSTGVAPASPVLTAEPVPTLPRGSSIIDGVVHYRWGDDLRYTLAGRGDQQLISDTAQVEWFDIRGSNTVTSNPTETAVGYANRYRVHLRYLSPSEYTGPPCANQTFDFPLDIQLVGSDGAPPAGGGRDWAQDLTCQHPTLNTDVPCTMITIPVQPRVSGRTITLGSDRTWTPYGWVVERVEQLVVTAPGTDPLWQDLSVSFAAESGTWNGRITIEDPLVMEDGSGAALGALTVPASDRVTGVTPHGAATSQVTALLHNTSRLSFGGGPGGTRTGVQFGIRWLEYFLTRTGASPPPSGSGSNEDNLTAGGRLFDLGLDIALPAGARRRVLVGQFIPRFQQPGDYTGVITIFTDLNRNGQWDPGEAFVHDPASCGLLGLTISLAEQPRLDLQFETLDLGRSGGDGTLSLGQLGVSPARRVSLWAGVAANGGNASLPLGMDLNSDTAALLRLDRSGLTPYHDFTDASGAPFQVRSDAELGPYLPGAQPRGPSSGGLGGLAKPAAGGLLAGPDIVSSTGAVSARQPTGSYRGALHWNSGAAGQTSTGIAADVAQRRLTALSGQSITPTIAWVPLSGTPSLQIVWSFGQPDPPATPGLRFTLDYLDANDAPQPLLTAGNDPLLALPGVRYTDHYGPKLIVDGAGQPWVFWTGRAVRNTTAGTVVDHAVLGGKWTVGSPIVPTVVLPRGANQPQDVQPILGTGGSVRFLLWTELSGGHSQLYVTEATGPADQNTSWLNPQAFTLSDGLSDGRQARAFYWAGDGLVHQVLTGQTRLSPTSDIFYSRHRLDLLRDADSKSGLQPFPREIGTARGVPDDADEVLGFDADRRVFTTRHIDWVVSTDPANNELTNPISPRVYVVDGNTGTLLRDIILVGGTPLDDGWRRLTTGGPLFGGGMGAVEFNAALGAVRFANALPVAQVVMLEYSPRVMRITTGVMSDSDSSAFIEDFRFLDDNGVARPQAGLDGYDFVPRLWVFWKETSPLHGARMRFETLRATPWIPGAATPNPTLGWREERRAFISDTAAAVSGTIITLTNPDPVKRFRVGAAAFAIDPATGDRIPLGVVRQVSVPSRQIEVARDAQAAGVDVDWLVAQDPPMDAVGRTVPVTAPAPDATLAAVHDLFTGAVWLIWSSPRTPSEAATTPIQGLSDLYFQLFLPPLPD